MMNLAPAILLAAVGSGLSAQWLNYPSVGTPRLPDGKPDLSAPAPRAADGRPDLSGLWRMSPGDFRKHHGNLGADVKDVPFLPASEALYKERLANGGRDDPEARCLPDGVPRVHGSAHPTKIVQLPNILLFLHENPGVYRQIFLDGRELPKDPNPTWMGYSVGHWEGDALVVAATGFNGQAWLDTNGHPTSDALRLAERFRRVDFGHLEIQITVDDPKTYSRPWTATGRHDLIADSDLIEYVCLENESSLSHILSR